MLGATGITHSWWALEAMAAEHGYLNENSPDVRTSFHDVFAQFIKTQYGDQAIHIADIGCGNARVLNSLRDKEINYRYYGLDINRACIQYCIRYMQDKSTHFIEIDSDNHLLELINGLPIQVAYFDSTLQMIEDPFDILERLSFMDMIYLGRTPIYNQDKDSWLTENCWGGAPGPMPLWNITRKDIQRICDKRNLNFHMNVDGVLNHNVLIANEFTLKGI